MHVRNVAFNFNTAVVCFSILRVHKRCSCLLWHLRKSLMNFDWLAP